MQIAEMLVPAPAKAIPDRRFEIKERTADIHELLDQRVGSFDSLSNYRRYLQGIARFRFDIERTLQIAHWPAEWNGWHPPFIAPALERDLSAMGLEISRKPSRRPDITSVSQLLGLLYVVVGSSLGARLLVVRAAALDIHKGNGAMHLAVMSNDIAPWRQFLSCLNAWEPFDLELAVSTARSAFHQAIDGFVDTVDE
ncbi:MULTISPECIES: biliverdin-producing heme oxygenase [Mesorhizobium]|uniref:Heme oxygenase n=1 Tax=Mesorhizobium denitrificans TaxID=2294114 RepID=A0A371XIL5_9HYPH|nr:MULTISPECIES: biliverdin-producing heme oxygenase [Mesorhizobium]RFC69063.1 hypothetical protein DY251_02905 [Mesorhizobium denitrificans]